MRNSIIYTYNNRPTALYQYLSWDPYNYKKGDQVKFILTDEELAKDLEVELPFKEKNGIKLVDSDREDKLYYVIPETHPYFNMHIILFTTDFLDDLARRETYDLNKLFVDTIIK